MAEDLDSAAVEALTVARGALAAADEALAAFGALRERVTRTDALLEAAWLRVRERATAFLVLAEDNAREIGAARGEAVAALGDLGAGLVALRDGGAREIDETRAEMEVLGTRVDAVPDEVNALVTAAEEADRRVQARLQALQQNVGTALARTEDTLRADLVQEMKRVEDEVERVTLALQDYVESECMPAVAARSQELYQQLVQVDEELRAALEAAAQDTENTTEDVLRVCNESYNDTLGEMVDLAAEIERLLDGLRGGVEDGMDTFEDHGDRWDGAAKAAERSLKEARDTLKEVEELLSRYSFVRM
ncbi:MAG TPA: hypothetical protein VII13_00070 [Vicinamibacteria bacterium]|jgi:hypothetical protein